MLQMLPLEVAHTVFCTGYATPPLLGAAAATMIMRMPATSFVSTRNTPWKEER